MRPLLAAIAVLLLAGAARAQDAGGCMKDTECKGARICQNHVCVDPPPVVACSRDLDCPGDDICVQRRCVSPKKRKGGAAAEAAPATPPAPAPSAPAPAVAPAAPPPAAPITAPAPAPAQPQPPPPAPVPITPPAAASQPPPAPKREAPAPAPAQPPTPAATAAPPAAADPLPPPLVAAPVTIRRVEEEGSAGAPVFSAALDGGLHRWTLGNNAEGGLRASESFSVEALLHGGWTFMAEGNNGLLLGIGVGVRADHLGKLPGHFTAGGLATFGSISGDKFSTIDFSGGALLLEYSLPLTSFLGGHAQVAYHFLNKNLSLLTLSAGVSFGN